MLRTPWGQDDPPSGTRNSANSSGPGSRQQTAGGRSQIVFGNYHEPASSSYKSMTTTHDPAHTPNSDYAARLQAARTRDSTTDIFHLRGMAGSAPGGSDDHLVGLPPPTTSYATGAGRDRGLVSSSSSTGSLRIRPDRNQSTIFHSEVAAGTPGTPLREHRSSSDIFHLVDDNNHPGTTTTNHYERRYHTNANSSHPARTLEAMDSTTTTAPYSPSKAHHYNEYAPSPSSAVKRDPHHSILQQHGEAAMAAEEMGFRGRRHYPQYHRSSNIFQN
ncbi:hypothetical protein DFJ77DRAFT_441719 [Powellomyces hirtus]|nr:hypothetical protein DFJ77DRAFT_441719 [Powellomyces hirtus]